MKRKSCIIAAAFFLLAGVVLSFIAPYSGSITHCGPTKSQSNLNNIVIATRLYAEDFDGKIPESFGALYPDYIDDFQIFFIKGHDAPEGYFPVNALYQKADQMRKNLPSDQMDIEKEKFNLIFDHQSSYKIWKATETECIFHERPELWKHGRILWRRIEFDGERWKERGHGELEEDEIAEFLSDPAIARAKSSK